MDITGIEAVPGERSSFTWIPVDAQGERCIYMFPNITARVTPEQIRTRFAGHIRGRATFTRKLRNCRWRRSSKRCASRATPGCA